MAHPRITFICELETPVLEALFGLPQISDLFDLDASVSLSLLDFSSERAQIVKRLNEAGVPVIARLLLPKEKGFWFNVANFRAAVDSYGAFLAWTGEFGLKWDGVAIEMEPDIADLQTLSLSHWKLLPRVFARAFNGRRYRSARASYRALIERMQADGYRVDVYQLPVIADERRARSTFFQRISGVLDLPADREILLLHTHLARPNGPGILWSYGPEADAISIGSTGGGVDVDLLDYRPLNWDEFSRDLRLAWVNSDDIHIFSLEGCVRQGFLAKLKDFQWDTPMIDPLVPAERVERGRATLQSLLWLGSHPLVVVGTLTGAYMLYRSLRYLLTRRS